MKSEGEPYSGVQALFNGDLHAVKPDWAPREEWMIASTDEILRVGAQGNFESDEVSEKGE